MLRSAAAPTDRALGETNASGTVLPPQRGWRINEGWFAAILLVVMVLSTIWSIHSANWVEGTQVLFAMALAGIVMGLVAAPPRVAKPGRRSWPGVLVGCLLAYTVIGQIFPTPRECGRVALARSSAIPELGCRRGRPAKGYRRQSSPFGASQRRSATLLCGSLRGRSWPGTRETEHRQRHLPAAHVAAWRWGLGYIGAWGLFHLHDVVIASRCRPASRSSRTPPTPVKHRRRSPFSLISLLPLGRLHQPVRPSAIVGRSSPLTTRASYSST